MTGLAAYAETQAMDQHTLVTDYATLVKRIAYHLRARLPPSVPVDDLLQAGMIGLLEASRTYDAGQGASFETYAGIRIRGAMLDEIRRNDWVPRSLHRRMRQVAEAIRDIELAEGRDARNSEVAKKLEISVNDYHRILRDAAGRNAFSLDEIGATTPGVLEALDDPSANPQEEAELDEIKVAVAEGITGLPERERLVMSLYYVEELNLREIGEVLGVSESRVCQIHGQALVRLKARVKLGQ